MTTNTRAECAAMLPAPRPTHHAMWRRRVALTALLVAVIVAAAGLVRAAIEPADIGRDAQAEQIAASLRCPTCQGLSVADSPSQLAQGMRDIITRQLDDDRSPTEVRAWFVARYGPWILLEPPSTGPAVLVWLLPVGVVALGVVLAWQRIRRPRPTTASADDPDVRRHGRVWAAVWALFAVVLASGLATNVAVRAAGDVLTGTDDLQPTTVNAATPPLRVLRQATIDEPDDPQAWLTLATALDEQGDLDASLRPYQRALDLGRDDPAIQRAAASALVRADRSADAEHVLRDLSARFPDDAEVLLLLGTAERALGRFTATATLQRFLQSAPDHPAADTVRALLDQDPDR